MQTLIGVGAGKFLEVRNIFAQISPNLPKKWPTEKDWISFNAGRIFSNQGSSSTVFAQISHEHDIQK